MAEYGQKQTSWGDGFSIWKAHIAVILVAGLIGSYRPAADT
jgi:hypothetical protein